ncbi:MAG TPA: MmgE/PrpD family protein, partial [Chloroflexota bacterium]
MSAISELAARLSVIELDGLEPAVVESARQRLFDTLAAFVAGAASPEGQALHTVLEATPERSTLDRIRYACGATRSTEIDDIYIPACATIGSMVVPAAVLQAAERHASDGDLLCALVAGYEAMARLARGIGGALAIYQGIWTTYACAPFATAAASARIARLDADQTAHALAIAASRSTGVTGRVAGKRSSRWFAAGCAAADGCLAAHAAEHRLYGDLNVMEQSFPKAGLAFDGGAFGAGDGWAILEVDTKLFRTSRQALSATEAFLRVIDKRSPEDIEEVQVWVPGQVRAMVDNPAFAFGIQRQLAMAATNPNGLLSLTGEARAGFQAPILVAEDPRLTSIYPGQWGGRVEVRWKDGSTQML